MGETRSISSLLKQDVAPERSVKLGKLMPHLRQL